MKQILQNLKTGATEIVEVPAPAVGRGQLLIRTSRTLVSAGTERMLVDFGRAGWLEKARLAGESEAGSGKNRGTRHLFPSHPAAGK